MDPANRLTSPPDSVTPDPATIFTPQQWRTIRNIIQYKVSIALPATTAVTNPLGKRFIPGTDFFVFCRKCQLKFSSKTQLLTHVRARPRYLKIKTEVNVFSAREYLAHKTTTYPPPDNLSLPPYSATSGGYSGGLSYYGNSRNFSAASSDGNATPFSQSF